MPDPLFSILIPTFNGAAIIGQTLASILSQSIDDFEILVGDDASSDDMETVASSFDDGRIKFSRNEKNLGYSRNLEAIRKRARGEIVYLMGQDDIMARNALLDTRRAFAISEDIGAVTRPYYWFDQSIDKPVRAKNQLNTYEDEIVTIDGPLNKVLAVFRTLDQLSGLAFRAKYMDLPFHEDVFPCHVYPFASILKKHPIVFLRDYNIAVRVSTSQTRSVSSIYDKSPVQSWVDLFETVFPEKSYDQLRASCIRNFVATNYVGLVQIRNYARYRHLLREIGLLLKYRHRNTLSPRFWFFALGCSLAPPAILIPLVDWYKGTINARTLGSIRFEYQL